MAEAMISVREYSSDSEDFGLHQLFQSENGSPISVEQLPLEPDHNQHVQPPQQYDHILPRSECHLMVTLFVAMFENKEKAQSSAMWALGFFTTMLIPFAYTLMQSSKMTCGTCYVPQIFAVIAMIPCLLTIYHVIKMYRCDIHLLRLKTRLTILLRSLAHHDMLIIIPPRLSIEHPITEEQLQTKVWAKRCFLFCTIACLIGFNVASAITCDMLWCWRHADPVAAPHADP